MLDQHKPPVAVDLAVERRDFAFFLGEGADHAHRRDPLADQGVNACDQGANLPRQGVEPGGKKAVVHRVQRHRHKADQGQLPVQPQKSCGDAQGQDQVGDQLERAAVQKNQKRADVAGDPRHEPAGLFPVKVRDGQPLELAVQGVRHPAHDVQADPAHEGGHFPGQTHAEQVAGRRHEQRQHDHPPQRVARRRGLARRGVEPDNQLIQDPALQEWYRQQEKRLHQHAGQGKQNGFPMRLEKLGFQTPDPAENRR